MPRTKNKKEQDKPDLDERIRRWYGYWKYCYGYLVPRWIEDMAGYKAVEIYCERYVGQTKNLNHFGCAIELERRDRAITTLRELRRAAVKITRTGYDFTAAATLATNVERERDELKAEVTARRAAEEAARPRRQADAQPDGMRMLRELEAKQLPAGAAANLSVMRKSSACRTRLAGADDRQRFFSNFT
jgi:hypothetical protein